MTGPIDQPNTIAEIDGAKITLHLESAVSPVDVPARADIWQTYYTMRFNDRRLEGLWFTDNHCLFSDSGLLVVEAIGPRGKRIASVTYADTQNRHLCMINVKAQTIVQFSAISGGYFSDFAWRENLFVFTKNHHGIAEKFDIDADSFRFKPIF